MHIPVLWVVLQMLGSNSTGGVSELWLGAISILFTLKFGGGQKASPITEQHSHTTPSLSCVVAHSSYLTFFIWTSLVTPSMHIMCFLSVLCTGIYYSVATSFFFFFAVIAHTFSLPAAQRAHEGMCYNLGHKRIKIGGSRCLFPFSSL